jgi:hypothetical protein
MTYLILSALFGIIIGLVITSNSQASKDKKDEEDFAKKVDDNFKG